MNPLDLYSGGLDNHERSEFLKHYGIKGMKWKRKKDGTHIKGILSGNTDNKVYGVERITGQWKDREGITNYGTRERTLYKKDGALIKSSRKVAGKIDNKTGYSKRRPGGPLSIRTYRDSEPDKKATRRYRVKKAKTKAKRFVSKINPFD